LSFACAVLVTSDCVVRTRSGQDPPSHAIVLGAGRVGRDGPGHLWTPPSRRSSTFSLPSLPPSGTTSLYITPFSIPLPITGVPPVPPVPIPMAQAFLAGRAGTGGTGPRTKRGTSVTGGTGGTQHFSEIFPRWCGSASLSRAVPELHIDCLIVAPIHRLSVVGMGAGSHGPSCRGCGLGRPVFPIRGAS
jgi:hypothetical protein